MTTANVPENLINECLDEVVVHGSDDWVMLTQLDATVTGAAGRYEIAMSPDERVSVGLEAVKRAFEQRLMVAGDVLEHEPGFVRWELSRSAAVERIGREWRAAGGRLEMGDVCWLANTPEGDTRAERVRDEVNARLGWPGCH